MILKSRLVIPETAAVIPVPIPPFMPLIPTAQTSFLHNALQALSHDGNAKLQRWRVLSDDLPVSKCCEFV